ncbi:MAG: chemotaxis protein CheW [Comamonadaceae bacterium]|nr:chemotaxis protein CheW [Burkholderiales bacterium]MEB2348428.1 chemotaxis protein CheW [Comamonadaceae bacterium]
MADREALKQLQLRLAARLQAARGDDVAVASWLAVECAPDCRLLLPLAQAGEIFSWSGVQPVPHARSWFLGVANLRGQVTGVVDLAELLGASRERSEQALAECGLLTLGAAFEINAAVLVERFAGLRAPEDFAERRAPVPGEAPYLGASHVDRQGVHWRELDLQALSQDAAFLDISA